MTFVMCTNKERQMLCATNKDRQMLCAQR